MKIRTLACFLVLVLASISTHAAIAPSAEEVHPLTVGAKAPAPQLVAPDGKEFDLAAALARKPTVLIFFRGGWCPFCNRHLAALAQIETDLRRLGYQIIGISPDEPKNLAHIGGETPVRYQLASARDMRAAAAYDVAYRVPAETAKGYRENGIELPPIAGESDSWLPVPSAFIIDRKGVVQ